MLKKDNTRVLAPLMFYENRKKTIFKVLDSVIYVTTEKYLCDDHMCLQQGQLYFAHKGFESTTFNNI